MTSLQPALLALLLAPPAPAQSVLGSDGAPDPAHPALFAWYDAVDGVNGPGQPAEAASVERWDDRSVHGRHLVRTHADPGRRPTFRSSAANGLPAVELDGDDYIWGDAASEFGQLSGPKTVLLVARVRSADGGYVFDGTTAPQRNACFTGQGSAPGRWLLYAGNNPVTVGPAPQLDVFQVHAVVFEDGSNEHFVDGLSVAQGGAPLTPLGGLILGSRYSVSHFLTGDVAELLVYQGALGQQDRQALEGYLQSKYPLAPVVPQPTLVDVFSAGDGVYPNYRIPSLLVTEAGSVLALAEGRQSMSDHAQNDIVLRRSVDGGMSWGPVVVLHDDGGNSLNDPTALQVREGPHAGRVLVMYERYPQGCHVSCVSSGFGPTSVRVFTVHSDDDGLSWSQPVDVTAQVKPSSVAAFSVGPGVGIQKRRAPHAGRLVMPVHSGPGAWKVWSVFSDDGGDSWAHGLEAPASQDPGHGNECQLVELTDGSLYLNSRSAGGTKHRKISHSADGGMSWSPLLDEPQLIEPEVMASVTRLSDPLDGHPTARMLYAGPDSQTARVRGTVWLSYDEGASWPVSKLLYGAGYAYSVLGILDAHTIGVLFERDGYASISLARFSLEWLTDNADCLAPAALDASPESISLATGGAQALELASCAAHAGQLYLVLGSQSGTTPGLPVDGFVLPLNVLGDSYFALTLAGANAPPFDQTLGLFDGWGRAAAGIVIPPGLSPTLAGFSVHHAAVVLVPSTGAVATVSTAAPLSLVP